MEPCVGLFAQAKKVFYVAWVAMPNSIYGAKRPKCTLILCELQNSGPKHDPTKLPGSGHAGLSMA